MLIFEAIVASIESVILSAAFANLNVPALKLNLKFLMTDLPYLNQHI